jgi:TonB family protein
MIEGRRVIQTTAAISPGSSGGGLFDEEGRLIGITTFTLRESQNLNFAHPADWIQELAVRVSRREAQRMEEEKRQLEARLRQIEMERQRAAEEERRFAEEERRREEEREAATQAAEKVAAERRAQEEEQKRAEEERRLAAERRRHEEQQEAAKLAAEKAAEERQLRNEERKRAENALRAQRVADFKQLVAERIKGYLDGPAVTACRGLYKLKLLPTGEVASATLLRSSGSNFHDEAMVKAIATAQPFPALSPDLFAELRALALPFGEDASSCEHRSNNSDKKQLRRVQPFYGPPVIYPRTARRKGIEGRAKVRLTVSELGIVDYVEVLESSPTGVFDQAMVDTTRKYKFEPDGTWYQVDWEVEFVLPNPKQDDAKQGIQAGR